MYTLLVMNSEALMHEISPRPKVNRLPLPPARNQSELSISSSTYMARGGVLLFGALVLMFATYQYGIGSSATAPRTQDVDQPAEAANLFDIVNKHEDSTLYFRDNEGVIVGSMVKIASESEKMIPNKIVSGGDRPTERELLTILSKY